MARARLAAHGAGDPSTAQRQTKALKPESLARLAAVGDPAQRLALQRAVGNAATRRIVAGSAPAGPQRLWDPAEFAKRTYQSRFTAKSAAQKAVEQLLGAYTQTALAKGKRTQAHANLLAQMAASAQLWLDDHTVTDEEGSSEDPARAKRMQGFKDFVTNVNAELDLVKTELGGAFTPGMGEEHAAYVKLRDHYKGSADSLFVKAAGLIDKAVGNPGDAASLEVEFEIPVDPSGVGFIGGRLSIEAERDDDSMVQVRTEMVVTGGAKIGVAKIKAELGGYIEAKAATAADAMNLYSYGLYRRFRESDAIPSEMTNYLWGGQSSAHGKKKAESWSRDLETRLFGMMPDPDPNDPKYAGLPAPVKRRKLAEDQELVNQQRERVKNVYVETGGIVAGKGEVGLEGVAELSLGVTYTKGTKITAETLERTKGGAGKKNRESVIGGQKTVGEAVSNITVAMEAEAGPLTGGLEIGISGDDREIEFSIGGKIPASAMDGVIAYLADIAVSAMRLYRTVKANESKTESLAPLMAFGAMQAKIVGTPVAGVIARQGPMGLVGDVGLEFVASIEREDGVWTGNLELRHVSSFDTEVPIGLKVELEKSQRLMKWTYSGGKWATS